MLVLAVVSFVGVFLSILKVLFGSYSLPHILREHSTRKQIENTYAQMHRSRDAFLYHIGAEREVSSHDDLDALLHFVCSVNKEYTHGSASKFAEEALM